ncbi:MAG: hypothetical protein JW827_10435 [Spirochaetes bacterium]|nr:hypothetical protein [Spirochaetota bacterium]
MSEKLIITLLSSSEKSLKVQVLISELTQDFSDMPLYKKSFDIHKGTNHIIINLREIGTGKFNLRIYHSKKLIDHRIIDVLPEKGNPS